MELTPIKKHVADIQQAIETDRNSFIGGSDAGTILGFNKYKSAYTLWAEMCGFIERSAPSPDNERVRLGHDLEGYVADRWMQATGKKCRRDNTEYSLQEFPFIRGHIDRRVIGEAAGLEIKTTSEFNKTDFEGGKIQNEWYAQCQHYMAVTGLSRWYLAVMQYGKGVYFFHIDRDETDIEGLVKAEASFYHMVQTKTAPVIDGSDSTADTLDAMWAGRERDDFADLTDKADIFDKREELEAQIKALEAQKAEIDNEIRERLGETTSGACGPWRVTYKTQERITVDSKKFKEEMPETYVRFVKRSESRTLRITKKKEKVNNE